MAGTYLSFGYLTAFPKEIEKRGYLNVTSEEDLQLLSLIFRAVRAA